MDSLFPKKPIFLGLPDAEIIYYPRFFEKEKADIIYSELEKTVSWQQDFIRVFGKTHAQPRLTAFYGNKEKSYSYSNLKMEPHPWIPLLEKIKLEVEKASNTDFNAVLLNYYRNGKDSNGWHADNEKELGNNPIIASLSFGAERLFQLKHNYEKSLKRNIVLQHGSLLLMKGTTQHFWKHQIPKTTKSIDPRINLTFRIIK